MMPGVGDESGEGGGGMCAGSDVEFINGLWLVGEGKLLVFVVTELIEPSLPLEAAVAGRFEL